MAVEPAGAPMHRKVLRMGRRIGIAIAGGVVVLLGIVLSIPLVPGQGVLVILLGLAILSLEFERPRIWLALIKAQGVKLKQKLLRKPPESGGS